jgi:hypothetical protein
MAAQLHMLFAPVEVQLRARALPAGANPGDVLKRRLRHLPVPLRIALKTANGLKPCIHARCGHHVIDDDIWRLSIKILLCKRIGAACIAHYKVFVLLEGLIDGGPIVSIEFLLGQIEMAAYKMYNFIRHSFPPIGFRQSTGWPGARFL